MGDPSGVGPEIVIKLLADEEARRSFDPIIIGNLDVLRRSRDLLGVDVEFQVVSDIKEATDPALTGIPLLTAGDDAPANTYPFGVLSAQAGKASYQYVELAVNLLLDGAVDALSTAPVNKEAIGLAGISFQGHLEYLCERAGVTEYATLLCAGPSLRVVHLSSHYSLVDACRLVTKENILQTLRLIHRAAPLLGFPNPSIGVAALNPHAGEGGLLGREEIEEIEPAIALARQEGINASGPWPADTCFLRAIDGEFDFALALYHDQGHIAIKVHDFANSYGVTLGPSVVRTSVDHGTAFEIAGTGRADYRGLRAAVLAAADLVRRKWAQQ